MLVPSLQNHPPMSGSPKVLNPPIEGFSRAFPALETPLNPLSRAFHDDLWPPFQNSQLSIKKNSPFLKKSKCLWVKSKIHPLFLQLSGRTSSRENTPFSGHFGNTHAVRPTTEWGGPGPDGVRNANLLSVGWQVKNHELCSSYRGIASNCVMFIHERIALMNQLVNLQY